MTCNGVDLFCKIGAADNLAQNQSTFFVEMNETAEILRRATPQSLVIMDEIGRGTSAREGRAIASAVLEHLHWSIACRCLFATHFYELGLQPQWQKIGKYQTVVQRVQVCPFF